MNSEPKQVQYHPLGLIDYKEAWDLQEQLFAQCIAEKILLRKTEDPDAYPMNHLLFCEHYPVYTLGKSGKKENLLLTEDALLEKAISYYHINRGGDITFHGPGQIVIYPILDLDQFYTDIHKYLRMLEEAVILTLADFKISATRVNGLTGVWLDGASLEKSRKICALGIKCSRWVTMHGLAFNVNTDLDYFSHIIPCGIDDRDVTSVRAEVGESLELNTVAAILLKHLGHLFDWQLVSSSNPAH